MDREQEEMQFLGLFGIYKEACKIMYSWRKLLGQITLALILPLSFILLAYIEVAVVLSSKIVHNEIVMDETRPGTPKYNKLSDLVRSEMTAIRLFRVAYFTVHLILSLLSTSAVVYAIACFYTGREVSFNKVMSVVPKVWKRLMVTFLCSYLFFFVYNVAAIIVLAVMDFIGIVVFGPSKATLISVFVLLVIMYLIGLVYMAIIWQLASVVSVLENTYGFRAMIKSKALIKGKIGVAIVVFLKLNISLVIVLFIFEKLVVHGQSLGTVNRTASRILCLLLLLGLSLFGLVIQTVIYFVCKSHHHENIDKSALSDHLEVYRGDYVPLTAKDVQLEQFYV
ncbi:hypothetical protein FCV25MIE_01802 [Fagus crenata]